MEFKWWSLPAAIGASHFSPQEFAQLASSTRRPHRLPLSHRPHRRACRLALRLRYRCYQRRFALADARHFALSEIQVEFAASSLLYGCFFGAMAAGILSDRYGRRSIFASARCFFCCPLSLPPCPPTLQNFSWPAFWVASASDSHPPSRPFTWRKFHQERSAAAS